MPRTVGVVDRNPSTARLYAGALADAGFQPRRVGDIDDFARAVAADTNVAALVATVPTPITLEQLREVAEAMDGACIVTIVDGPEADLIRAVVAGATGALEKGVSPESVASAVQLALRGAQVLPASVGQRLAQLYPVDDPGPGVLDEASLLLLRHMRDGHSIGQLAARHHWSDGHMRRRLRHLYARMGVASRDEAVARAEWWGVLE